MSDEPRTPENSQQPVATPDSNPVANPTEAPAPVSFKVDEVFSHAFDQSKGFKLKTFIALALAFLVIVAIIALQLVLQTTMGGDGFGDEVRVDAQSMTANFIGQALYTFLSVPIGAGLSMFALKYMRGEDCSPTEVVRYYPKILPLFATVVMIYLLVGIGFLLFIIPGIYLLVSYYFATVLVVDKDLSPWEAMETSRKAVTKHWFSVFVAFIGVFLFVMISMLPLGIGLIWSIPWSFLVYATLYQRLFGG